MRAGFAWKRNDRTLSVLRTRKFPDHPLKLDRQPTLAPCRRVSGDLNTTHALAGEVISLPMHPCLDETDMATLTKAVKAPLAS